jgi:hypothetical protein
MPPPARPDDSPLDPAEQAGTTSRSCPLLPTPSRVEARGPVVGTGPRRLFFQPHWPEPVVEDALKVLDRACHHKFAYYLCVMT